MIALFILLGIFAIVGAWILGFSSGSTPSLPDPWLNPALYTELDRYRWEYTTTESLRNKILEMEVCRLRQENYAVRYNYECKFCIRMLECCGHSHENECKEMIKELDKKIENLWKTKRKPNL